MRGALFVTMHLSTHSVSIARALALFVAVSSSAPRALAQWPDAGPDSTFVWPGSAAVTGVVQGDTPLEWWTADGNGVSEDMLVRFSTTNGDTRIGPLRTGGGVILGWPGDLVQIGAQYWGVEVGQRRLYKLDPDTGTCTLVGASPFATNWASVHSLAYDATGDRLFGVDTARKQLLRFDRVTGQATAVGNGTLVGFPLVRSLAFDAAGNRLLAQDNGTGWLLALNPTTGVVTPLCVVQPDPNYRIEELQMLDGELFASRGEQVSGVLISGQLSRVDLLTGALHDVGPTVPDCSPHCLLLRSAPASVEWRQLTGPGVVTFVDPHASSTAISFSAPGVYELEFRVRQPGGVWVGDPVEVVADGCPNDPFQLSPSACHGVGATFCAGDGSAAPCPCGNYGGPGEGCRNSTGAGAYLNNLGGGSVALDDALLSVSSLPPGKAGLIFMGEGLVLGGAGKPFYDGLRCVTGHVRRFPVRVADANGVFAVSSPVGASGGAIQAGSTRYFQAWYRDSATNACGAQANLSNGFALTFTP